MMNIKEMRELLDEFPEDYDILLLAIPEQHKKLMLDDVKNTIYGIDKKNIAINKELKMILLSPKVT